MLKFRCRAEREPTWPKPPGMREPIWRLLGARGIGSAQEAERFLHPSMADLLDHMALSDMGRATARIGAAIERGETICVWGDYDVDGVSATAILTGVLSQMGADVFAYLPSRHGEGYGLNEPGIAKVAERAQLLITVDCGVSAADLVEAAQQRGLSVIVTDHHRPGDRLPDCPVVNPLLSDYENPALCGAGVAFKVAMALDEAAAKAYIDLAALATVADVVALTGENRAIVAMGLVQMRENPRPGVAALMDAAGIEPRSLTAGKVAFQLAPRLNAGGRLGSAERSLDLLTAPTRAAADPIAHLLNEENLARRKTEAHILQGADRQLRDFDFARRRVIVLHGEDWNVGVVGLAASRLVERYNLPTVLLSGDGEQLTGSCRSIPGVDIFENLKATAQLLVRFGGHKQAAGLTIERGRVGEFAEALNASILATTDPDAFVPSADYDLALPIDEIDTQLVEALGCMQPTGFGNPAPVFMDEASIGETRAIGRDGAHLNLTVEGEVQRVRGIWFGAGDRAEELRGTTRTVLYVPKIDTYMGRSSLAIEVKAVGDPPLGSVILPDEHGELRLLHAFLTKRFYNSILPDCDDASSVDVEAVEGWLRAGPRGTLIVASDVASARALLGRLSAAGLDGRLDVCVGDWPRDNRAFHALAVIPSGPMPDGYERVIVVGAKASLMLAGANCPVYEMGDRAEWVRDLPDKDQLRALYVAARALLRRPYAAKEAGVVSRELAEASGLSPTGAHAGLYVLRELGLVDFEFGAKALSMPTVRQVVVEESRLFQLFEAARHA